MFKQNYINAHQSSLENTSFLNCSDNSLQLDFRVHDSKQLDSYPLTADQNNIDSLKIA